MILPLLLAAATAAVAAHPAALAGRYDGGQSEVAAGLVLRADGHFLYRLSYGALDEEARGTWEARDGRVLLTTRPAVRPPRFEVLRDEPVLDGGLYVKLDEPRLLRASPLRLRLFYGPGDPPLEADTDADGRVRLPDSRRPAAFQPLLPAYPADFAPIPFIGKAGHRLTLRFEANDIGKADFRDEPLAIEGDRLLLPRHGRILRFQRH